MEQTTNDDLNDHAVERAMRSDAEEISEECDALKAMLLEKNRNYGSSALSPVRIFSKADTVEQIRVRLDDKLSRLMRGSAAGEDVIKDLLGYLILLRIAQREQHEKDVHVAASPEVIDEALKQGIPAEFLKASKEAPSIVDVLSDPNGPASKPLFADGERVLSEARRVLLGTKPEDYAAAREDVGFALTDTEAAEAERAVDEEWGGAIRRKLGIARGTLDGVADDLEEVGGWEETVKEIRQTLRETADPNYVAKPRPEERGHLPTSYELDRAESIAARLREENKRLLALVSKLRNEISDGRNRLAATRRVLTEEASKFQREATAAHRRVTELEARENVPLKGGAGGY